MTNEEPNRLTEHNIRHKKIDKDALRVLRRLHDYGFYAYLVGGSVRDLLIGRKPKDFDVVTSAQPREIKRLFRRCRLIGRRFRLAHIMGEQGKIIETATFRAKPKNIERGQIIFDDNQFGTPRSDALRRDFTVNALFYDADRDEVIDYVDGLADLEARILRTIGDPVTRFREDPVRMLRAIKFSARLGFSIEGQTRAAILSERAEIGKAALPRLYEELVRLAGGGACEASIQLMQDLRLLEILIPELAAALTLADSSGYQQAAKLFSALDNYVHNGHTTQNGVLLAVLMWPVIESVINSLAEPVKPGRLRPLVEELTRPIAIRVCIPRRVMETTVILLTTQLRADRMFAKEQSREALARSPHYGSTLEFARLRAHAGQLSPELVSQWQRLEQQWPPDLEAGNSRSNRRKGGHRRGRRQRRQ